MNVNKKDIMKFFEEREKNLKERIKNSKDDINLDYFKNIDKGRLAECIYTKTMISIIWNIIHQKKGK